MHRLISHIHRRRPHCCGSGRQPSAPCGRRISPQSIAAPGVGEKRKHDCLVSANPSPAWTRLDRLSTGWKILHRSPRAKAAKFLPSTQDKGGRRHRTGPCSFAHLVDIDLKRGPRRPPAGQLYAEVPPIVERDASRSLWVGLQQRVRRKCAGACVWSVSVCEGCKRLANGRSAWKVAPRSTKQCRFKRDFGGNTRSQSRDFGCTCACNRSFMSCTLAAVCFSLSVLDFRSASAMRPCVSVCRNPLGSLCTCWWS